MDLINKTTEFSGKYEDWNMWLKTFLSKARLRGYKDLITGTHPQPNPSNPMAKKEYQVLNKLGYVELMLSCQEEVCFNLIDEAKSETYPNGDVFLAWKSLQEGFEPKTSSSLVLLKKEFNLCALRRTDKDPDKWITQLLLLRQRLKGMGHQMTDLDVVIHILNNLPKEYESVVESLETDIDNDIHVDIEQVTAKLQAKYKRFTRLKPTRGLEKGEGRALFHSSGNFKGNRRTCGEYGHKAAYCKKKDKTEETPISRNKESSKKDVKCSYCHQKGHTVSLWMFEGLNKELKPRKKGMKQR
jgi:hypothetical protein